MSAQEDISIRITDCKSSIVDNDFMKASFDQSTSDMFKLFSSLHEQIIPRRDFDSNALAGIPGPDVQTWVTRTTMNGQKVEI
jgi:hypothetical protein